MVNVLILTQGQLAEELLTAARHIAGPIRHVEALSLDWNDDLEHASALIRGRVERIAAGDSLLILTDIFGGTPYNLATAFFEPGRVEILAGVNLPIVVRLACLERIEQPVTELAEWIEGKGRRSICLGGLPHQPQDICRPAPVAAGKPGDDRS